MNSNTDVISPTKRVSSCAEVTPGEHKLTSTINEQTKEHHLVENETDHTGAIDKNLSERKTTTKETSSQRTSVLLKQDNIPIEENIEHNENKTTEINDSNEIQMTENEIQDYVFHDVERENSGGCCGCFADVCYCMTWYCRIMTNAIGSFLRSCGASLCNLCRRNANKNEDDGNYFYSDLNETFSNDIDAIDNSGNPVHVEEYPAVMVQDSSVSCGNDGGYDNIGVVIGGSDKVVDIAHHSKCGLNGGGSGVGLDNSGVDLGGIKSCGVGLGGGGDMKSCDVDLGDVGAFENSGGGLGSDCGTDSCGVDAGGGGFSGTDCGTDSCGVDAGGGGFSGTDCSNE